MPEEPESLPTSGVMTSPNFPAAYPNDLHERKTIEVAKGSVINIHFTDYELESPDQVDYLEVTDGDGTLLGHFGAAHYVDNGKLFFYFRDISDTYKLVRIVQTLPAKLANWSLF